MLGVWKQRRSQVITDCGFEGTSGCNDSSQFAGRPATYLRYNQHALAASSVGVFIQGEAIGEFEESPDSHSQFHVTKSGHHPGQGGFHKNSSAYY